MSLTCTFIPIRVLLARNINLWLFDSGLTAQQLADKMGISVAILHRVRHQACTRLDLDFLDSLFTTTEKGPDYFLRPQPGISYVSKNASTN